MTLDTLEVGQSAEIVAINHNGPNSERLAELGLIPGQRVQMLKKAPLGEPIQINVMHYDLCLRKKDAAAISIRVPNGGEA